MVSPVRAKGCPSATTLYDTRVPDAEMADAFLGTVLVTPAAGWHTRVSPGCTKPYMAVPPVCRSPDSVLAARVTEPRAGMPSCTDAGPAEADSAQSCPRIVTPSRQRPARTSTRLVWPLPALLAAMQNGKHGAVAMQAVSPLSAVSCPHRGISQTVASSSLQVPREMQSCVVPCPASYRV
jgi:hypothetical protein